VSLIQTTRRTGRQPVSSRTVIEHAAFRLFDERGFELTTIDDIAEAAGIARRTFFSYFASKNDVPWGSFEHELDRMRCFLDEQSADLPLMDAIRLAVLDFNTVAVGEEQWHRRRLALILSTPALQAHSTLRYTAWREVINEYAATRLGLGTGELTVQMLGYTSLATAIAAYEVWLATAGSDLHALLDDAFRQLTQGLGAVTRANGTPPGVPAVAD
jgi:mycofactocin system transcriptional regulator